MQHGNEEAFANRPRWTPASWALCALLVAGCSADPPRAPQQHDSGEFPTSRDIGDVEQPGSLRHRQGDEYELQGSGSDVWGTRDAFHFASRTVEGDVLLRARAELEGESSEPYRKAMLMMRESLEADAAYVDLALHQNGLASLQYRPYAGAPTLQLPAALRHPRELRLERSGDAFTAVVSRGEESVQLGPIPVVLPSTLQVGIGVSSHDRAALATATFHDLALEQR